MEPYMERSPKHAHSLILTEDFHPQEADLICCYCDKAILYKSSVYTCTNLQENNVCAFILHKYCALPMTLMHPEHHHILNLVSTPRPGEICFDCFKPISDAYTCQHDCLFRVCLECATQLKENISGFGSIQHWSHQHPLRLLQRYAAFECDGCNKVASDFSYLCDVCSFWIHKDCASLPQIGLFGIHHKHPLQIADSLPYVYQKFPQFCKICEMKMDPTRWLYYCAQCRFFAHIHCALSKTPNLRDEDDDPDVMHLPAPDELLTNSMMQKWIKDMIVLSVQTAEAPHFRVNHWAHEHPLTLKNISALIIADENDLSSESERLITCRGCTKPISSSSEDADDVFYECNICNYSLHRYCGQFPEEIHHPLLGTLKGFHGSFFRCSGCLVYSHGFLMDDKFVDRGTLDLCCACLPRKIKHKSHHHPLQLNILGLDWGYDKVCKACRCLIGFQEYEPIFFECVRCDFRVHQNCALMPGTVTHRWDAHPLRLVLSLEDDIEGDHPQEFECEFCSEEIDTNGWFYHCNVCDLSFHLGDCVTACSAHVKVLHFGDLGETGSLVDH